MDGAQIRMGTRLVNMAWPSDKEPFQRASTSVDFFWNIRLERQRDKTAARGRPDGFSSEIGDAGPEIVGLGAPIQPCQELRFSPRHVTPCGLLRTFSAPTSPRSVVQPRHVRLCSVQRLPAPVFPRPRRVVRARLSESSLPGSPGRAALGVASRLLVDTC